MTPCKHEPQPNENFPGLHGHLDRPQTRLGEPAICPRCGTVKDKLDYVPCLDCTGVGEYARFYGIEELRWWSEQYRAHDCPGLAEQNDRLIELLENR